MGAPAIHIPRGLLLLSLLVSELWNWRPLSHLHMFAVSPPFKRLHWQMPGYTWRVIEITTFSKEITKMRAGMASGFIMSQEIKANPSLYFLASKLSITTKAMNHLSANAPSVWECCWTPHLLCAGTGTYKCVLQILPCQKASWHQWVCQSATE